MHFLIDISDRTPPVRADATGAEVYARFQSEAGCLAIAVVDGAGAPIGLLERNTFMLRMAGEYGRALYAHRAISTLMDAEPRVASSDTPVLVYIEEAITHDPADLLKGFVVTEDGRYAAVGTALNLLKAGFQHAQARADELAEISENLAWAETEALAAARAKTQFLAVMSHEIRTPLNGVLAIADIVDRKLTQTDLRPYMRAIIDSGQTLNRLLTDALDLSRAEAGGLELVESVCVIRDLVTDLDPLWRPLAEQKGLSLTLAVDGDADRPVRLDAIRLKQVFNNLLGNALKFTVAGGVSARFAVAGETDERVLVAEIADTGPGIADDKLDKIFEPFAKADEHATSGGAGLGLSICRELLRRMGGELSVRSAPGEGATFVVRLPLAAIELEPVAAAAAAAEDESALAEGHVLVVDDNATNRLVASTLLEMFGLTSDFACDGVEAVAMAASRPFDVILMDVKMPRMDGVEATRAIRGSDGDNARTPIIALTANADPADAEAYRAAGMDQVVRKPLAAGDLMSALNRALSVAPERRTPTAA